MTPKNITNEELARMVQEGFADVDKRFAHIDKRFDHVEARLAHHDEQLTQTQTEIWAIRKELDGVVYRPEFEALQDHVHNMKHDLATLKKKAA